MAFHEGRAFHASLPGGQQGGRVHATPAGVVWEGESAQVLLPMQGLHLEAGGASDRIVFFRHPGVEGWVVTTTSLDILKDSALASRPGVAALVGKAHRKRAVGTAIVAGIVGVIALAILSIVFFRGSVVRAAAGAIPAELEVTLGQAAAESIVAQSVILESEEIDAALASLTTPLLAAMEEKRYEYRFRVVADPSVNAFALPGGEVFVHSGLILKADRAEELAGVLAHEIAHVQERHAMRGMVEKVGLAIVAQMLIGDATGIEAVLLSSAPELAGLKFSRDFEREADREGFGYLERARIDPTAMSSMFRKLAAMQEAESAAVPGAAMAILSTHPPAEERFEALDELARERGPFTPSDAALLDFEAFQETIRELAGGGES